MTIGERGGTTGTADEGFDVIETFKHTIADQVRLDILGWLGSHSTWHRDDLRVSLSPADKNVLGAVVGGLVRSGCIEETGERRRSGDPASHGRKSNVFRLCVGGSGGVNCASSLTVGTAASRESKPGPGVAGRLFELPEVEKPNQYEREAA